MVRGGWACCTLLSGSSKKFLRLLPVCKYLVKSSFAFSPHVSAGRVELMRIAELKIKGLLRNPQSAIRNLHDLVYF